MLLWEGSDHAAMCQSRVAVWSGSSLLANYRMCIEVHALIWIFINLSLLIFFWGGGMRKCYILNYLFIWFIHAYIKVKSITIPLFMFWIFVRSVQNQRKCLISFCSHVAKNFPVETISVKRYVIKRVVAPAQDLGIDPAPVGKQVGYIIIYVEESLNDHFPGDILN